MWRVLRIVLFVLGAVGASAANLSNEDGYELWLRYRPLSKEARIDCAGFAGAVLAPARAIPQAARTEIERALDGFLGTAAKRSGKILLGLRADHPAIASLVSDARLAAVGAEGFVLTTGEWRGERVLVRRGERDALGELACNLSAQGLKSEVRTLDAAA